MAASRSIRVLYFGGVRELLGVAEESLEGAPGTVGELAAALTARHPALGPVLSSLRFAVNEDFAAPSHALAPGDVVAVIPPVSGG
ncbi:MAG: molybdopterin converting factor subunit 1 [Deltaproteobacteria bacterium]|nr:molybdopterin converting factor subunit 1 [Deltaproteobacteria bacterium]